MVGLAKVKVEFVDNVLSIKYGTTMFYKKYVNEFVAEREIEAIDLYEYSWFGAVGQHERKRTLPLTKYFDLDRLSDKGFTEVSHYARFFPD